MALSGDRSESARSPLEIAHEAVERSRSLGAEVEAYVQFGRTVTVKTYGGEVESAVLAEPRGVGIRAVQRGKTGYVFSTDASPTGIEKAVSVVKGDLEAADEDSHAGLPSVSADDYPKTVGLWSPGVSEMDLEQKTELALRAEAVAREVAAVEAVEESVYSDEEEHVAMCSSLGVEAEARHSYSFVYVVAHAGGDGERQTGLGYDVARDPTVLDPESAGLEAARKASALVGAKPCKSGLYTLVLDAEVAAALLSTVAQALSADAVLKGRSVFAGKLGSPIGSQSLTLSDDGLHPEGMATSPFDGEGVPQQTTVLIDSGVLSSYLYDTRSARREGGTARSTGNARRSSYRVLPQVGPSNLVVRPGEGTLEEVLERIGEGLYVEEVAGLHAGVNAVSGEISLGMTGRLIEGGRAGTPVREVTMATDFGALLSSVCDVGGDARWVPIYGSVYTPCLVVDGVAVSGI